MNTSLGYKLGFNVKRVADTLAIGTHDTVMSVGDRVVGFLGDIRKGYRRARSDTIWVREIKPRAERFERANSGMIITGFKKY